MTIAGTETNRNDTDAGGAVERAVAAVGLVHGERHGDRQRPGSRAYTPSSSVVTMRRAISELTAMLFDTEKPKSCSTTISRSQWKYCTR